MDTTKTITHVSLCAGYGGIDLGLSRAIPNLRTIAFSEIEAFACANLVAKMEAGLLDAAPIWTNLKTFPWSEFRDRVDILSGGYPCQPFSAAGKRLGRDDPRHLWPWIADGIVSMRPRVCFFENVEGHISLGLREVISELEGLGYQTTWGVFSAREVGAPHQRKRVFILAYRKSEGLERYNGLFAGCGESRRDASEQKGQASWAIAAEIHGQAVPGNHSTDGNRQESWATPSTMDHINVVRNPEERSPAANKGGCKNLREEVHQWATPRTGATDNSRPNNKGGIPLGDQARRAETRLARGKDIGLHGQVGAMTNSAKLNPRWVETLMGLPIGWTMPSCIAPVTIAPTNSDCLATELCQPPLPELF